MTGFDTTLTSCVARVPLLAFGGATLRGLLGVTIWDVSGENRSKQLNPARRSNTYQPWGTASVLLDSYQELETGTSQRDM